MGVGGDRVDYCFSYLKRSVLLKGCSRRVVCDNFRKKNISKSYYKIDNENNIVVKAQIAEMKKLIKRTRISWKVSGVRKSKKFRVTWRWASSGRGIALWRNRDAVSSKLKCQSDSHEFREIEIQSLESWKYLHEFLFLTLPKKEINLSRDIPGHFEASERRIHANERKLQFLKSPLPP